MKAAVNFNGKSVEITLTPEQEAEVKRLSFDFKDIKTVEDAFSFLGINYAEWLEARKALTDDEIAYGELKHIVKAINAGQEIDKGYSPWFYHKGSASGFSFDDYGCAYSGSAVGSRLLLLDSERAHYAAKQFVQFYNRHIN